MYGVGMALVLQQTLKAAAFLKDEPDIWDGEVELDPAWIALPDLPREFCRYRIHTYREVCGVVSEG